jgi:flagellar basal-body rod protein FlgF/flagellar basal-body rod protein FlgG
MENLSLISLSRQVALERELDVVANNIANINTTGYKSDGSMFEEYLSSAARDGSSKPISYVRDRGVWHDMSQGPVEHTGNQLDVAIDGQGFLAVQTPGGVRYTRNGALQINATGQLVTSDGYQVMGDGGPIALQPTDHQVSISRDGTISVREGTSNVDSLRGKLKLVSIDNPGQLQKAGSSTFNFTGNGEPPASTTAGLIQGAVEKSNVRGVVEMSRMIEITRTYTQIASLLQQESDQGQQTIDKLSDVPTS